MATLKYKNGTTWTTAQLGEDAGFGQPTATINNAVGSPAVKITYSGPNNARVYNFEFTNCKGQVGATGANGGTGPSGNAMGGVTKRVTATNSLSNNSSSCTACGIPNTGISGYNYSTWCSSTDYGISITSSATASYSANMECQLSSWMYNGVSTGLEIRYYNGTAWPSSTANTLTGQVTYYAVANRFLLLAVPMIVYLQSGNRIGMFGWCGGSGYYTGNASYFTAIRYS